MSSDSGKEGRNSPENSEKNLGEKEDPRINRTVTRTPRRRRTTRQESGYIPKKNVNVSLRTSSYSCISSIELAAIEDCLIHVKDSYQEEIFDIVILSDSLRVLEALKDCNHFDRNINKTLAIISELQESGRKVTLVWIPAHVGIPGNEKADALAKAATTREQIDRWKPFVYQGCKKSRGPQHHPTLANQMGLWPTKPTPQDYRETRIS